MLEEKLAKNWGWYRNLPWPGKICCVVMLLGIALLAILVAVSKVFAKRVDRSESDTQHRETVDIALSGQENQRNILDNIIKIKKSEIATKLNRAKNIDVKTLKARERIKKAESLQELLDLQRELGL